MHKINKTDYVVFLGSTNAMPMMYALELKIQGYNVLYFVDAKITDTLHRPENHFPNINYPYPDWIIEINMPSQILAALFPKTTLRIVEHKIFKKNFDKKIQAFILNGFFISLSSYIDRSITKISLSHGSDLDSWADIDGVTNLSNSFKKRSIFKYIPHFFSRKLIKKIVINQFNSIKSCDAVMYFPKKFNKIGDRVLEKLNIKTIYRYDISFIPLLHENRNFKKSANNKKLVIFSPVRFTFKTFDEGNEGYNKGNDHIINGISLFYKEFKNIEVHFVEKGVDTDFAKKLCRSLNIEDKIIWHKEMKFFELLKLYQIADICFDQIGDHWIGAVGGYALWLGKPLIANDIRAVEAGIWPEKNPICRASSGETVYKALKYLENEKNRERISTESKIFVEENMSPKKAVSEILRYL